MTERDKRIIPVDKAISWFILHSPVNVSSAHLSQKLAEQQQMTKVNSTSEIIGKALFYCYYSTYIKRLIYYLSNLHITLKCQLKTTRKVQKLEVSFIVFSWVGQTFSISTVFRGHFTNLPPIF